MPIIRGVYSFITSLFGGVNVLMRSAEVYGEEEPSKFEKWLSEKLKINVFNVMGFLAVKKLPSEKLGNTWEFQEVMYSAATNVNDARRAERLPGHQCFDY